MAANTFTARYRGECSDCPHAIEPGDEVTYVANELVHAVCGPDVAIPTKICPGCFLAVPVNGVCGVCE